MISDRQIEEYLELDKRKDLSKATKLFLIRKIAEQPCLVTASINWPQQGKVNKINLENSPLWHLVEIKHHFQEDEIGSKYLVGLTFKIWAGVWSRYFLNQLRQNSKAWLLFEAGVLSELRKNL